MVAVGTTPCSRQRNSSALQLRPAAVLSQQCHVPTIKVLALQVEAAAERGGCCPCHAATSHQSCQWLARDGGSCAALPPCGDAHSCLHCSRVLHGQRLLGA